MRHPQVVIPSYLIETPFRCLAGAWVIERSVFYLHDIDWIYQQDDPEWTVVVGIN